MLICPAVHIPTRSLLRSSSTPEPSDPLYSIVFQQSIVDRYGLSSNFKSLRASHGESKKENLEMGEAL